MRTTGESWKDLECQMDFDDLFNHIMPRVLKILHAAAAAKSLQSCPTLRSHRRQPTRLCHLWDSPGKNSGVGCHFLLQKSCTEVDNNLGFTLKGEPLKWDRKQTKIVTVEEGWCYRIKDLRGLKTTRRFQDSSSDTLPANSEDMRRGFDPRVGKIPWRREWQSTTALPGESHGRRSLVGYSL